jgi:hypothetical protein
VKENNALKNIKTRYNLQPQQKKQQAEQEKDAVPKSKDIS